MGEKIAAGGFNIGSHRAIQNRNLSLFSPRQGLSPVYILTHILTSDCTDDCGVELFCDLLKSALRKRKTIGMPKRSLHKEEGYEQHILSNYRLSR